MSFSRGRPYCNVSHPKNAVRQRIAALNINRNFLWNMTEHLTSEGRKVWSKSASYHEAKGQNLLASLSTWCVLCFAENSTYLRPEENRKSAESTNKHHGKYATPSWDDVSRSMSWERNLNTYRAGKCSSFITTGIIKGHTYTS